MHADVPLETQGEEAELVAMMTEEKWLGTKEASRIFDISIVDASKQVQQTDVSVLAKYGYKNVPQQLIRQNATARPAEQIPKEPTEPLDYSDWENRIKKLGGKS